MSLVLCQGCNRHVRSAETHCPFCNAAVTAAPRPLLPPETRRLSRAALLVAASLAMTACGGGTPQPTDPNDGTNTDNGNGNGDGDGDIAEPGPPDDDGGGMPKYGGPPPPEPDEVGPPDGDDGMAKPMYGMPTPEPPPEAAPER
jgi:hypothetical protein